MHYNNPNNNNHMQNIMTNTPKCCPQTAYFV